MDNSSSNTVLFVVVVFLVLIALTRQQNRRERDGKTLRGFPYRVQEDFLSPAELRFFQTLHSVVGNRAVVCSKVRLGDVFRVTLKNNRKFYTYLYKIDRKHVDFLLCDPATMRPLVGIELDDKSHQRQDRRKRDAFVNQVFKAAGLPLLHVPVKRGYVATELAARITPHLAAVPGSETAKQTTRPTGGARRRCPKCGGKMILRTAKRGANAGNRFWGCSNYPKCHSMLPYAG